MKYYLYNYELNNAVEFDINGFIVVDENGLKKLKNLLKQTEEYGDEEIYFGANEFVTINEVLYHINLDDAKEITEEEKDVLLKLFNCNYDYNGDEYFTASDSILLSYGFNIFNSIEDTLSEVDDIEEIDDEDNYDGYEIDDEDD